MTNKDNTPPQNQTPELEPQKVLIIDDDAPARTLLSLMLKRAKHITTVAEGANQALGILEQSPELDMIVVDYMLPGTNGIDFVKRVRAIPEWENIRIVMLSARSDNEVRTKAFEAGINKYMIKPILIQDIPDLFRD